MATNKVSIPMKQYIRDQLRFTGNPDDMPVLTFLSNVTVVAEQFSADWVAMKAYLPSAMVGAGRDWFIAAQENIRSYDEFDVEVKSAFIGSDYREILKQELYQRSQEHGETLRHYCDAMRELAKHADPGLGVAAFYRVVWSHMLPEFRAIHSFPPKTHTEARETILELDTTMRRAVAHAQPRATELPHSRHLLPSWKQTVRKGSASASLLAPPSESLAPSESCQCSCSLHTSQPGLSSDSSVRSQSMRPRERRCFNCGSPDHFVRVCPHPNPRASANSPPQSLQSSTAGAGNGSARRLWGVGDACDSNPPRGCN